LFLHDLVPPDRAADRGGSFVLAAILIVGGAFNLLAAFIGMRREGDLKSTMGRQLQAVLGKRGAISFWLGAGVVCVAAGLWFLVRAL
jgi:hypothetical protein